MNLALVKSGFQFSIELSKVQDTNARHREWPVSADRNCMLAMNQHSPSGHRERSVAIHVCLVPPHGLPRRFAPRRDGGMELWDSEAVHGEADGRGDPCPNTNQVIVRIEMLQLQRQVGDRFRVTSIDAQNGSDPAKRLKNPRNQVCPEAVNIFQMTPDAMAR